MTTRHSSIPVPADQRCYPNELLSGMGDLLRAQGSQGPCTTSRGRTIVDVEHHLQGMRAGRGDEPRSSRILARARSCPCSPRVAVPLDSARLSVKGETGLGMGGATLGGPGRRRAAAVHEDNICCSGGECSAGNEKKYQWEWDPLRVWGAWERCGGWGARIHVIQDGSTPGGRVSSAQGDGGIMIHPMQRRGGGRFSRRAAGCLRGGLVEQSAGRSAVGPAGICVAVGRPGPARHERLRWTACPPLREHEGPKCDIDDTLIWASSNGDPVEGAGCR